MKKLLPSFLILNSLFLKHPFEIYQNKRMSNFILTIILVFFISNTFGQQNWEIKGPYNQGGRTKAIGVDIRDSNIILSGGTSGGMYRTTDGGTNWINVSNALDNPTITGVVQNPLANDIWYYITGEAKESVHTNQNSQQYIGDGVFKSIDNGVTWTQLASTAPENSIIFGSGARSNWQLCHDIVIDPIDGAILVSNIGGIYRSADAGGSWTKVLDAAGQANFGDVVHLDVAKVDATNRRYYAGTHSSGSNSGFFKSSDGSVWSKITSNDAQFGSGFWERIIVAIAPSDANTVWFLLEGSGLSTTTKLFKYNVAGDSWIDRTANLPDLGGDVGDFNTQNSYNMVLTVKPDNPDYIFIGGTKLWRSSDGFATKANAANTGNSQWIGGYSPDNNGISYPNQSPNVHELVFLPGSTVEVLSGNDGGLSSTADITTNNGVPTDFTKPHPVTWSSLNNGLYTSQAFTLSIDPSTNNSSTVLAGFHNGNFRTTAQAIITPWDKEPNNGIGSWNAIAPGGNIWYTSQKNGTIQRNATSTPNGPGVHPASAGTSSTNTLISPFILDKNDSEIMYYAAKKDLWRHNSISTVTGGTALNGTSDGWTNLGGLSLTGDITAMETSVSPANILYIGTSDGKVYKISNSNTGSSVTISDISTGLSTGHISCIDVDPDNADHVYVTFSNYGIISIYRSTDAGQSWENISGTLEENLDGSGSGPSIRWIHVFKKTNSNVYFVGTTTGLYSTETLSGTSTQWTQEGTTTIGNVPVSMIRSRKSDGYLAIATHGKGIFKTNILVDKANQSITFAALTDKTFGDASFALTATASSGLDITYTSSNTDVATISGTTVTIIGVGTTNITASQTGNANYNAATNVIQGLSVDISDQSITFAALADKTFGDAPFALTATASSGLDITYTSSNTAVATITGSTVTIIGAGTTNITASQAGNANYNAATNVIQGLSVDKSDQSITFAALADKTFGDAPFALTATASSGLDMTYISSNTDVATITGSTVTIIGAGTTNITASQAGNINYNAATNVIQGLLVNDDTLALESYALENVKIYKTNASTLRIIGLQNSKTNIILFSLSGKQILNKFFQTNDVKDISLPVMTSGIYIIKLQTDKGTLNKKIFF